MTSYVGPTTRPDISAAGEGSGSISDLRVYSSLYPETAFTHLDTNIGRGVGFEVFDRTQSKHSSAGLPVRNSRTRGDILYTEKVVQVNLIYTASR